MPNFLQCRFSLFILKFLLCIPEPLTFNLFNFVDVDHPIQRSPPRAEVHNQPSDAKSAGVPYWIKEHASTEETYSPRTIAITIAA